VGFGTGFAAPHVSGLVAVLLERDPELTPTQHRDRLLAACTALSGAAEDEQGAGLVSPALVFP
jgi:subtilisin family serine protease